MIVRHSEDVPITSLPNTELQGKELISEADGMGHTAYEFVVDAETMVNLKSPDNPKLNHMYYCISGDGCIKMSDDKTYTLKPDSVIAMSSGVSAQLIAGSKMRLYVVFCVDCDPSNDRIVMRSLDEIIGTERDVDWGCGRSRRFLLKRDGFPVSLTNTLVRNGITAKLHYANHKESAYYISGKTTYTWKEGDESAQTRIDSQCGTVYNMNKNDRHTVTADEDSATICGFYPALRGEETHTHDGGYSVYDA